MADETETTAPQTAVSKTTYVKFAKEFQTAQAEIDDAQETRGDVMKRAGEASIHKGAFKLVQKLKRMDPAGAQEFLACVDTYAHWEGLLAQQQLPLDDKSEAKPNGSAGKRGAKTPAGEEDAQLGA